MAADTHTDDRTFDRFSVADHALRAAGADEQYIVDAENRSCVGARRAVDAALGSRPSA